MVRHLYLARHGRTALNAQDRIRGLADPPLDEVGLAQARALGERLAAQHPVRVYSSPLQRAVSTAEAIATAAGVSATADPRFNDRDYGEQTGRLRAEVVEEYGSVDDAPGVEPVAAVLARVLPALDEVLDEGPGDVVVVTHDAVIRPVLLSLDPGLAPQVQTASWHHLVWTDAGFRVQAVDLSADTPL